MTVSSLSCVDRVKCGQGNAYNVEKFEKMRDRASQEACGSDTGLPEHEDGTEARKTEKQGKKTQKQR